MFADSSVIRACGGASAAGICRNGLIQGRAAIEYYIVDPPIPVEISQLGLTSVASS